MISSTVKRNLTTDLGYDIKEKGDREIYRTVERNNNINLMEDDVDLSAEFELHTEDFKSGYTGPDDESTSLSTVFQGEWPIDKTYWQDGECSQASNVEGLLQQDTESMMSFCSSTTSSMINPELESEEKEAAKADVIYSLICMLKTHDKVEVTKMLQTMSNSKENCTAMSRSGCLPLLVQLLHDQTECQTFAAYRQNVELRQRASQILRNIVYSQPDDKKGRREARVLKLLEQVRDYCEFLKSSGYEINENESARCLDDIVPAVAALMKMSFDEEHRHAMCLLGGLQAIAELLEIDQETHGCSTDPCCTMIRRYSGMALTNLTFGDGTNKALLCSMKPFMQALVMQLHSPSEELRQVSASVLRNLSWRADTESKNMLREVGAVTILMTAAMGASKESTLKSILSALWNLSAHCSENKADICGIEGALGFLVTTLTFKSTAKNLAVVENGGGILRNVSSHIALQNEHRVTLRKHNCLQILLHHLKSPSLTVVSNACGTLWNLSARNPQDQQTLWEMGAVGMLKKLVNSKHKMISMGSSAALKNLLSAQLPGLNPSLGFSANDYNNGMPSLHVRKQKMMNTEIDQSLSETYDNTDSPKSSPTYHGSHKKSSNVNTTKFVPPRNQGIPQRVSVKKQNTPVKPNIIDIDSNMSSSELQQKNNTWATKSNLPDKNDAKVQMRAVSEGRGIASRSFGLNKNNATEPHPKPTVPLMHPNNIRPHSVPCRKDRSSIPSFGFSPTMSNKPSSNRMSDVPTRISSPKTGKKLHISKSNCTNFAQKIGATKREDAESAHQASIVDMKQLEDPSQSSRNLVPCSLPNKSIADSRIPLPRLNNYVEDNKQASGIPPPPHIPLVPAKDVGHISRRESSLRALPQPGSFLPTDGNPPTVLYNTFPKSNQSPYQQQAYLHSKQQDIGSVHEDPSLIRNDTKSNKGFVSNSDSYDRLNVKMNAPNLHRTPPSTACDAYPAGHDETLVKDLDAPCNSDLVQEELFSNGEEKLSIENNVTSVSPPEHDYYEKSNVVKTSREMYTHETPLMFSRCSSLGSLSSFDQHSVHGDRSSSSDLSQLNSGEVSPSDLPDSPTACTHDTLNQKSGPLTYERQKDKTCKTKNEEKDCSLPRCKMAEESSQKPKFSSEDEHGVNSHNSYERIRSNELSERQIAKSSENVVKKSLNESFSNKFANKSLKSPVTNDVVHEESNSQKKYICTDAKVKNFSENHNKETDDKSPHILPTAASPKLKSAEETNLLENKKGVIKGLSEESNMFLEDCCQPEKQNISHKINYNPSNDAKEITSMTGLKSPRNYHLNEKSSLETQLPESLSRSKEESDSQLPCRSIETTDLPDETVDEVQGNTNLPDQLSLDAQKLTDDMLEAVVDGADDMTVSTLSCLSDIDNARPPSIMGDLGSLSLTNSEIFEEAKMSKIKKLQFSSNRKTSLLKELQISRLTSDGEMSGSFVKDNDCSQSLSNSVSDMLEHINPPSLLDDMTFTASTGSLNSLEDSILDHSNASDKIKSQETNDNSLNERLCEADVMVQMYNKELSHITGNCMENSDSPDEVHLIMQQNATQAICDALEDLTETACDTIASDVEFVDELPCDDDDLGSETLLAPQLSCLHREDSGEGSTENLTVTLTEESPFNVDIEDLESYDDHLQSVIASENFEVLRENADLILDTLQNVCLSENSEFEGLASNDMLEDETLSLVSNESDEDSLSPDGAFADHDWSMSAQRRFSAEKLSAKKTSMPSPKDGACAITNRIPMSNRSAERSRFGFSLNTVPSNTKIPNRFATNNQKLTFNEQFSSNQSIPSLDSPTDRQSITSDDGSPFDSRTFTRRKPSLGKNIPNISDNFHNGTNPTRNIRPTYSQEQDGNHQGTSNYSSAPFQSEGSPNKVAGQRKVANSKIASVWKNKPKTKGIDSSKTRTFQ